MKRTFNTLAVALLLAALSAHAQHSGAITTGKFSTASIGSDFWFALPSNNWGASGGVIQIYITALDNTSALVQFGNTTATVPITADTISIFTVPDSLEMESSGIVENKGIHVFSSDANLSVYFMSRQPGFGEEGSCVIPTANLGTNYVVAAEGSLFEGNPGDSFDDPSECVIVANQDNTQVTITPSCNCRKSISGNENGDSSSKVIAFRQGVPFTVTLDQGQSMQLMPVLPSGPDNFDMTGTIIHATRPIGMIGASMFANVPADFPGGNFMCEMIPPVSKWGKTYYATNFDVAAGESVKNVARYLLISSVANQTIFRASCGASAQTECVIDNQFGIYWDELEGAQKFFSSAPFLLVSYSNSSTFSDGVNSSSAPTEVSINPLEQFSKTIQFVAAEGVGNSTPYSSFVNIICNVNDAMNATLDGKPISGFAAQCIDDSFEIITDPDVAAGTHTIVSDSGIGVYLYGFGNEESYAWSTPVGIEAAPLSVQEPITPSLQATILEGNDGLSLQIILPTGVSAPITFQLSNVLGESVLRSTFSVGTQTVDASSLPRGVYFYRLTSGQVSQSGKVILGE